MKNKYFIITAVILASLTNPLIGQTTTNNAMIQPKNLFEQGKALFQQKAFNAASVSLTAFIKELSQKVPHPQYAQDMEEAIYMLLVCEVKQEQPTAIASCRNFLQRHPATPYKERITALLAHLYFLQNEYLEVIALTNSISLDVLPQEMQAQALYEKGLSYLKTDKYQEALLQLNTLTHLSDAHKTGLDYYKAICLYKMNKFSSALPLFKQSIRNKEHADMSQMYMAEIALREHTYNTAIQLAQNYINRKKNDSIALEMYRISGTANYKIGQYRTAIKELTLYDERTKTIQPEIPYMIGVSYYQEHIYSKVPNYLMSAVNCKNEMGQSAYLYSGLAFLQLMQKDKARMAFEQAANSNASLKLQEEAAYNYALSIYETSYSAFGESVNTFEHFLNTYPQSKYSDKIEGLLADIYISSNNYELALQSVNRIKQPSPQLLKAKAYLLYQLGTQNYNKEEYAKALEIFKEADKVAQLRNVSAANIDANCVYWAGECLYRLGEYKEAVPYFKQAIAKSSDAALKAYSYYNLGYIAFNHKEYSQSASFFQKWIEANIPSTDAEMMADAYNRLGDCALQARDFTEAVKQYQKAADINAKTSDYALYQLALVAGIEKNYTTKIGLLNKLITTYPNSALAVQASYEKGRGFVQEQQPQMAIATYQQMIDKYPKAALTRKAMAEMALLYYQTNQTDKAIGTYKKVITEYPGSEEAKVAVRDIKTIFVDAGKVNELQNMAQELSNEAIFEPNEQDSLSYLSAEKAYMRGENIQAKNSFRNYLETYPQGAYSINAHYYLALIYQTEQNIAQELNELDAVLAYPDSPYSEQALLMRGALLMHQGDYLKAMHDYQLLLEKASNESNRLTALNGQFEAAQKLKDNQAIISAANKLLEEPKITSEQRTKALYARATSTINSGAMDKAMEDLKELAKDTHTEQGAEAKYIIAQLYYKQKKYGQAEKVVMEYIQESTPHLYWLARSFIVLSDVYHATGRDEEARQYLKSLKQNYTNDDDIQERIKERLEQLQ